MTARCEMLLKYFSMIAHGDVVPGMLLDGIALMDMQKMSNGCVLADHTQPLNIFQYLNQT